MNSRFKSILARPRSVAAIAAGKITGELSRRLGRGGGTALPGMIVERLDPTLLRAVAGQFRHGSVVVTGTNGKTTTARMLAEIAAACGLQVIHNRSGSNLMRGLAATAVECCDVTGRVACGPEALGVFEVDEATLAEAVAELRPRAIVFTNLFRDQLDRYGEVDSIFAGWRRALARLPATTTVVLNSDDPSVAALGDLTQARLLFYGVDDLQHSAEAEHASDARWCPRCGSEYRYLALYYGHVGVWRCPGCGSARPSPQVRTRQVLLRPDDGSSIDVETPDGTFLAEIMVGGLYNAYNALAAAAGAHALGIAQAAIATGLTRFKPVFGRQERMWVGGREVRVLLCKNPAGANQILREVTARPKPLDVLVLLNDGVADGRDVSWIWDVDFELLAGRARLVAAAGDRGADMALRLTYAGLDQTRHFEGGVTRAIDAAIAATPKDACLHILPTYTAMLQAREYLARRAERTRYWEE